MTGIPPEIAKYLVNISKYIQDVHIFFPTNDSNNNRAHKIYNAYIFVQLFYEKGGKMSHVYFQGGYLDLPDFKESPDEFKNHYTRQMRHISFIETHIYKHALFDISYNHIKALDLLESARCHFDLLDDHRATRRNWANDENALHISLPEAHIDSIRLSLTRWCQII